MIFKKSADNKKSMKNYQVGRVKIQPLLIFVMSLDFISEGACLIFVQLQ